MENQKEKLAKYAANKYLQSNINIGIGTGSTVFFLIKYLNEKVKSGEVKNVKLYPTSIDTKILLNKLELPYESNLAPLDRLIDITIDGADEVLLESKTLIKGGGGAHVMEKVVAYNSEKLIIIADETKIVKKLGEKFRVPIEVVPSAINFVLSRLEEMGFNVKLRECSEKKGPLITDNNNYILDVKMNIEHPEGIERYFKLFPGIIEIGIFTHKYTNVIYYQNGEIKEV